MYERRLRVFVSSRMQELAAERSAILTALDDLKVDAWIFEKAAGARPDSIQATYTEELDNADLYLGIFWKGYGRYTVDEYDHARATNKDRLVYVKPAGGEPRDPELEAFLKPLTDVERGVTWAPFSTLEELAARVQDDVSRWQAAIVRRAVEAGLDRERARQAQIRAAEHGATRQRIVNLAPQAIAELFKDRTVPMAQILDALLAANDRTRAVTIFGQGGVGKTALACCAMNELEKNPAVHGIVYLSTRTTGITFERVYRDSARMLGDTTEQELMKAWKEKEGAGAQARVQPLIEAFGSQRSVLLLDNLESVMDAKGVLVEPELQQFLNAFLAQRHGARLLITSREPLNPSDDARKHQKLIALEEGLPPECAIELLRERDEDGALGLRDADEALLKSAAEKTQGYPAALEAIVSILSETAQPSLERLLADDALFRDTVISNLVRAALSRLDANGHLVMQALAVFGRPVRDVAVHYLLEAFAQGALVHETIGRLTRGLYINVKRTTGELILHPFYREFSYATIPTDPASIYNRAALESRAAGYYAQLRAPREAWKSIRDLDPQLFEFEHWIRAAEWDRAAEVLSSIDLDFLNWQGYARRMRTMRAQLDGRIGDRRLQMLHHDSLGQICQILGPHDAGIPHFVEMKAIATELSDFASVGQALRGLGETARLLGRHQDAITYCREALALQRQRQADTGEIARALFFCALSYSYGGYPSDAIDCSEDALVLAQQAQDVANIARAHDALALANLMLERWEEAIAHARSAIEGDTKVQSLDGICFVGNVEAMALFGAGRHDEALRVFERVVRESNEYDMPRALALCLFNQARALRALNRADAAADSARAALAIMVESRFSAIETAQSLVDALVAAASGDRHGELRRLLDCARTSLANPDLYPPGDLIREVRAAAVDAQLGAVAAEAADLDAIVRSRQHARWEARDAGVPPTS